MTWPICIPLNAFTGSSKVPKTCHVGWLMKFFPTSPLELARPSGNARLRGQQQKPRRLDGMGRQHHHSCLDAMLAALRVEILHAGYAVLRAS